MRKPADSILRRNRLQAPSDGLRQHLVRARPHTPQEGFQLREGLFNGRQVGRVGGQPEYLTPLGLNQLAHPFARMRTQVIQDDDLAGLERGSQHLLNIRLKGQGGDGSLQDERRSHAFKREPSNHGRVLAPVAGDRAIHPLSARGPCIEGREGNVRATFVDKDQALDWEERGEVVPRRPISLVPLGGTHLFFFRVQPRRAIARLILAVLTSTPWEPAHNWQCCSRVKSSWATNWAGRSASKLAPFLGGRPGMGLAANWPVTRCCLR